MNTMKTDILIIGAGLKLVDCPIRHMGTEKAQEIYLGIEKYLEENGSIGIREVRGLLGVKKGAADAQMTKLMMQCRIVTGDITRVYRGEDLHYNGWQISSFCTPEALFETEPDVFPSGMPPGFPFDTVSLKVDHSPQESLHLLVAHIREIAPSAPEALILKALN